MYFVVVVDRYKAYLFPTRDTNFANQISTIKIFTHYTNRPKNVWKIIFANHITASFKLIFLCGFSAFLFFTLFRPSFSYCLPLSGCCCVVFVFFSLLLLLLKRWVASCALANESGRARARLCMSRAFSHSLVIFKSETLWISCLCFRVNINLVMTLLCQQIPMFLLYQEQQQ